MKAVYLRPETKMRQTCIKNYVICLSGKTPRTTQVETTWDNQLGKGRGDDIWSSGEEQGSDGGSGSLW